METGGAAGKFLVRLGRVFPTQPPCPRRKLCLTPSRPPDGEKYKKSGWSVRSIVMGKGPGAWGCEPASFMLPPGSLIGGPLNSAFRFGYAPVRMSQLICI